MRRIIVGLSGASGVIYGIRLLEVLQALPDIESHLVMSTAAATTIPLETDYTPEEVRSMATVDYRFKDIAAAVSSGSFRTDGMIVLPCSMKTLASIAYSFSDNLLSRAADVILKERRKLVLCPRETPLHLGHLRAMVMAAELGAYIVPPMPAFYHRPRTLDDIINQTVNRVLDLMDVTLPEDLFRRWQEAAPRMSNDTRARALAYVAGHHVMTLATHGPEGPWAAAVFYAADGFRLVFLSAAHTRHAQNSAASPRVAATIQEDYDDWPAIQGIQLEGTARQLMGDEREAAIDLFTRRYPFLRQAEAPIDAALRRVNWYELRPERLYFVDNSRGFGHRDEIIGL